jgi:hypothetical protein
MATRPPPSDRTANQPTRHKRRNSNTGSHCADSPLGEPQARQKNHQIESAPLRLGTAKKKGDDGLSGELDAVVEAVKAVPWTALQELKGNSELLKKIEDAEAMLSSLRKALS